MNVLLSVIVVTYNHRDFVRAALDSILMQQVDFSFEVIIADDASTDGTQDIISSHLANWDNFRGKLICLFRDKNMGMQRNALDAIGRTRGKYIAFLEGDDYWMDPQKLCLQVRFMEANPDHFLCAHKTMIRVGEEIYEYEWRLNRFRESYSVQDYMRRLFFHTSSMVLRARREFPAWLERIKQLDQALVLLSSAPGSDKIRILPKKMSVYRMHAGGITQTAAHKNRQIAQWSYIRLLCGVARECPWIERRCVTEKLREALVQSRLRSATQAGDRWKIILCNFVIIFRLVVFKYTAFRNVQIAKPKVNNTGEPSFE